MRCTKGHAQALSARAHTIIGAHVVPQDPPARLHGWSHSQQLSHSCSRGGSLLESCLTYRLSSMDSVNMQKQQMGQISQA